MNDNTNESMLYGSNYILLSSAVLEAFRFLVVGV